MKAITEKDTERFLQRVEKTADACWRWTGQVRESGYGVMRFGFTHVRAHRFAYRYYNGALQDSEVVRHTCDNKLCVNPAHLVKGDNWSNTKDMVERKRHPTAKTVLTTAHVREIARLRLLEQSLSSIARQTGLKKTTVASIVRGSHHKLLYAQLRAELMMHSPDDEIAAE